MLYWDSPNPMALVTGLPCPPPPTNTRGKVIEGKINMVKITDNSIGVLGRGVGMGSIGVEPSYHG